MTPYTAMFQAHYPIQAPNAYQKLPHIAAIDVPHRMVYHAQIQFLDDQIGNLTNALKLKGIWNTTLMILHVSSHLSPFPCSTRNANAELALVSG